MAIKYAALRTVEQIMKRKMKLAIVAATIGLVATGVAYARGGKDCGEDKGTYWTGCTKVYMDCLRAGGGDTCIVKSRECNERCGR